MVVPPLTWSNVMGVLNIFCQENQNQFHSSVTIIHTNNAKEYIKLSFQSFCSSYGII